MLQLLCTFPLRQLFNTVDFVRQIRQHTSLELFEVKPYLYFVCGRDLKRLYKIKLNLNFFPRSRKNFPTKVFRIFIRGDEFECYKISQFSEVHLERNANLLNCVKVEPLFASENFNTIYYFNIDSCTYVLGDRLKITIGLI